MLEDDIVVEMKRMVARTFGLHNGSGGKGKKSQRDRDDDDERDNGAPVYTSGQQGLLARMIDPRRT